MILFPQPDQISSAFEDMSEISKCVYSALVYTSFHIQFSVIQFRL